ncbi:nucleoporin Nup35 [Drosophila kikkawai]|uniref:Nucleoporin NUP53 n=1 Tax=Drosophila kikkawai TaxID=30033 RepID=A0A6P4JEW2_DROKI|nr:nucleoporin Nup35 [Drosophila kikkawai]
MEPMNLGSPVNSPSSNQSQYLPPFLMGDPQALTPHKNTLSPKPGGRYNVSFATSPGGSSPHEFNRSALNSRTLFGATGAGGSGAAVNANTSLSATPSHTHQVGPPTQGLFDSLREPVSTPQRNHLSMLQMQSPNQSYQSSYHTNDSFAPGAPNAINASMRALCSPLGATASPLVASPLVGGSTDNNRLADFWVTIFGFSPGAITMVLQHFTLCGIIVDVVRAPQNGNWMHVRYSSRIESDKALNYNHKVIAGNVMVGVTRCTDRSVIDKENSNSMLNQDMSNPTPGSPTIRPLAQQSYKLAQNNSAVSPGNDVPQKSSGLVNKAMDLLFGW